MRTIDAFNGDADGICSLHQLRLAEPRDNHLITGVKRDISLVGRIVAEARDEVTVLDVSLDKNRDALIPLLDAGAQVRYFDHHFAGEIPDHPSLDAHIDPSPTTCTGLIVNEWVDRRFLPWAVTAAFGDNLLDVAREAAMPLGLETEELDQLEELGMLLNYNGYGSKLADLHFSPADLYRRIQPYESPFEFVDQDEAFGQLAEGYADDHRRAESIGPVHESGSTAIFRYPDEPFARRISGVFANELAQQHPDRAHAILTDIGDEVCLVSVRAPLSRRQGADALCRQFETGGGRAAAAGINRLPLAELERFTRAFDEQYSEAG